MEVTEATRMTEVPEVMEQTAVPTLWPLPVLLSVLVEAD